MKRLVTGLLVALVSCGSLAERAAADGPALRVEQAWIQPAKAGQFETWAFATITNDGAADALVAVTSPDASSIVLRAATVTDAGRKMRTVIAIPLPAHGALTLSPDAYLLAFINVRSPLTAGDSVTGSFRFMSGAALAVTFRVRESEGDPADAGR